MSLDLGSQFKSLLEPQLMEGFIDQTINFKIHRFSPGQATPTISSMSLDRLPKWFTLYEVKLALWNATQVGKGPRDPAFSPSLVFLGKREPDSPNYKPIELIWKGISGGGNEHSFVLPPPQELMTGPPDERFVDSAGSQKSVGKLNRIRMTINDIFELDKGKDIPEIHVFLYTDLVDRIVGPRPLGERDVYGRIVPYFPYLDPSNLPDSAGASAITPIIVAQANQTALALNEVRYLDELVTTLEGELQLPKLDGVKFMRWAWNNAPAGWEGPAILFFGTRVTHNRPYMRFFPGAGQPLTKIHVKGVLPIPDLVDPNILMTWKQDKNPDVGKDCMYMKIAINDSYDLPLYATMRVWNDGTSDLLIQPPKQKRLLDPLSDLESAPEILSAALVDLPYVTQNPSLA